MHDWPQARGDDATPLYLQFANGLRERLQDGVYAPGRALPSERDLCELTGMSRVTVRKGIDTLIEEGLLYRRHGSGTYVAHWIKVPATTLSGFSQDATRRGEQSETVWIMKSLAVPTEEEARLLDIPTNLAVARLSRVRLLDGEPLAIENAVVPAHFLPPLDQLGDSLYAALERLGNRPVAGSQSVCASLATPTEAGILCVSPNSEILRIERLTRLANGAFVELTRSAYRGDRYVFVSEITI